MENLFIAQILIEGVDEETFDQAENWLCILEGQYLIYEGASTQVVEAAQQRGEETGETISEVILDWATSYMDHLATQGLKELNY